MSSNDVLVTLLKEVQKKALLARDASKRLSTDSLLLKLMEDAYNALVEACTVDVLLRKTKVKDSLIAANVRLDYLCETEINLDEVLAATIVTIHAFERYEESRLQKWVESHSIIQTDKLCRLSDDGFWIPI